MTLKTTIAGTAYADAGAAKAALVASGVEPTEMPTPAGTDYVFHFESTAAMPTADHAYEALAAAGVDGLISVQKLDDE